MREVTTYIESLDLPAASERRGGELPAFIEAPQAVTIGAQLAEFDSRVPRALRPTISHGLLLAQLAADKASQGSTDPWTWFTTYNQVIGRIGWLPLVGEISEQQFDDRNAELHKAIIPLLAAAFGPAAAVGSIIIKLLEGLQSMNADSPWITLFERKSQSVKAAKFGLSYVDAGDAGGAMLKTVFFGLTASNVMTQVLFMKISAVAAQVKTATSEATLSAQAIADTQAALAQRVAPFLVDNIRNIDI